VQGHHTNRSRIDHTLQDNRDVRRLRS
jgi:hypothetical protein